MVHKADAKFTIKGQVGLGFPGAINPADMTLNCANVPVIKGQSVINDLSVLLDRDIKFENDANCFLLSECFGGNANDCATVLGITLGTGVGGAIFVNGGMVTGKNAFAGEIGHYPLPATLFKKYPQLPTFRCACGRDMCLETYVSGTGLANLYQHYTKQRLSAPAILDKYLAGEQCAIKVLAIYFDILSAGIATAILVLDPDAIVFGGGLSQFDSLLVEFTKRLPEHLLKHVQLPIIVTAKYGSEGGRRGAALLNYR